MSEKRWMWLVYTQAALLQVSWIGARLMIGFAALQFTSDPFLLALVAASFALPAIGLALPVGGVMDRWGAGPLVVVGTTLVALSCVGAALSPGLVVLIVANTALGLGQLLCMVGQQGYIAERAAGTSLDSAFGGLTSAMSVGQLVGPVAIAGVATIGAVSALQPNTLIGLLGCAAFAAIVLPLGLSLIGGPRTRSTAPRARLSTIAATVLRTRGMWRALVVSGVVLAAVDLLYVFLPAWAVENGVSAIAVGWLLALRGLVAVVSRLGMGRLVAAMGRRWLLVICLTLGVIGFLALTVVEVVGAAIAMLALGIALGLPQPLTISWVVLRAPASIRGAALGLRVTSNRVVQLALPLLVGAAAAPLGVAGMFLGSAVVLAGAAAVTLTAGDTLGDVPDATRPE